MRSEYFVGMTLFCKFILFSEEIKMSMVTYLRQLFPFLADVKKHFRGKVVVFEIRAEDGLFSV